MKPEADTTSADIGQCDIAGLKADKDIGQRADKEP